MRPCNKLGASLSKAMIILIISALAITTTSVMGQEVGAVTYQDTNQAERIYAFVGPGNGKLSLNFWNGSQWNWRDQGPGQNALVFGKPGVITYQEGTQKQKIYAFMRTPTGRLWTNYWSGSQWLWADLGTPLNSSSSTGPIAKMRESPGVVTFKDGSSPQEIHAFVICEILGVVGTTPFDLCRSSRDSSGWHWEYQGNHPAVSKLYGTPGVVSYKDGTQARRTYAFVRGNTGRLYLNYSNGSQWNWRDQGKPSATSVSGSAGVVTYADSSRRIYAFVRGGNGRLYVNYWNGSQWGWRDQGTPPGTTVSGSPGAITYKQDLLSREIHAFVRGANGRLYRNYWNGSQWLWASHGTPPGTNVAYGSTPEATTYVDQLGVQRIHAFVKGTDGKLYVNYRKNNQWLWANQGTP